MLYIEYVPRFYSQFHLHIVFLLNKHLASCAQDVRRNAVWCEDVGFRRDIQDL